jgi:hypothetical protein
MIKKIVAPVGPDILFFLLGTISLCAWNLHDQSIVAIIFTKYIWTKYSAMWVPPKIKNSHLQSINLQGGGGVRKNNIFIFYGSSISLWVSFTMD